MEKEKQFMSKEELTEVIIQVKNKEEGASQRLWEGVSRFIYTKARQRYVESSTVPLEDLLQVGYIAMVEAAETFDIEQQEYSFFSTLSYSLKTNFAKEAGTRTSKRDGLQYAISGDSPVSSSQGEESLTIFSTLADEQGETPFLLMEQADFVKYCRSLILEALETLSKLEGEIVRLRYLHGWKLSEVAQHLEKSASYVGQLAERGLYHLSEGSYSHKLKEAMYSFGEYEALENTAKHGGICTFTRTNTSAVEAKVLLGA